MLIDRFFKILEIHQNNGTINARIELNRHHQIYDGHFPQNPITPGVCQIQMVTEISETALNKKLTLSSAKNIKFLAVLIPSQHKYLDVDLQIETKEIETKESEIDVKAVIRAQDTIFFKFKGTYKTY